MDLERSVVVKVPYLTPKRAPAQVATSSAVGYLAQPASVKAATRSKTGLTEFFTWHRPHDNWSPCFSALKSLAPDDKMRCAIAITPMRLRTLSCPTSQDCARIVRFPIRAFSTPCFFRFRHVIVSHFC